MRILVLSNLYPPHAYGGYELSCRDVVEHWRSAGHDVLVLTSQVRLEGVETTEEDPNSIRRDLRVYWEDHEIVNPPLWTRFRWERSNEQHLDRAISAFRPDVLSVWAMGAMSMGLLVLASKRGLPAVSVVCDEWPIYGPHVDAWLRPLASHRRLARTVHLATGLSTSLPPMDDLGPVCFVSSFLRDAVREHSSWTFHDSHVVFSGISRNEFPFSEKRGDWSWRLLYVGRIDPRKGIDTAIRGLAECPVQAELVVLGRGDDRYLAELRHLAAKLGVENRVTFAESQRSQLAEHYQNADAVIFPSVWDEPFGLVPLEAMSCGTPVVATMVGGASEFLSDGKNCLTFLPGDVGGLVACLERMSSDPDLRTRLVGGGIRTAEELGDDRLAEELGFWHEHAVTGGEVDRPPDRVV